MNTLSHTEIESLLARFMDGTTTVEEEAMLADFFRTATVVPTEWEDYRAMFAYFDAGMVGTPADDATEGTPCAMPCAPAPTCAAAPVAAKKSAPSRWWKYVASTAACLLLLAGVTAWWLTTDPERTAEKPCAAVRQSPKPAPEAMTAPASPKREAPAPASAARRPSPAVAPPSPAVPTPSQAEAEADEALRARVVDLVAGIALETELRQRFLEKAMEEKGYVLTYDENGSIYYTKTSVESQNIIPL